MTTPEHTLVGVHFAIAAGLLNRFGWRCVVLAGLVSNIPDLDGLPMLINMARFESGHRVWGHNFLAIAVTSILIVVVQSHYDILGRLTNWLHRHSSTAIVQEGHTSSPVVCFPNVAVFLVAIACQSLHLPCDMVVSGGSGLSHWLVQPWWPFSTSGYVYPMIPWGDPGPTIILMFGAVVLARHPLHRQKVSIAALLVLTLYLIARRGLSAV